MDPISKIEIVPFISTVNPSFWNKFTEVKLDIDRLKEPARNIWGYFSNLAQPHCPRSILEVDSTSFNTEVSCPNCYLAAHGKLINKNTIEQFKDCNKLGLISGEGDNFWKNVENGEVLENPAMMNFFLILSFVDLKKYHYYYWFAFPVPSNILAEYVKIAPISSIFNEAEISQLYVAYETLQLKNKTHFIIQKQEDGLKVHSLSSKIHFPKPNSYLQDENIYFAFADVSSSQEHPGWPLRNFLTVLSYYCPELRGKQIAIISFRLYRCGSLITCNSSTVLNIRLPTFEGGIEWTGWEKNERGNFGPRFVNMKDSMDPKNIAEESVDLNLKLMKWRLAPDIDLDKVKNSRCLLLGSGTLGCAVARTLLAWGVRNITLVDNATVSFSNPVRQTLFTYEDSLKNTPKALAAAENLKNIFPGVNAKGVQLSIPMPGHPVGDSLLDKTREDVEALTELMKENDMIFLLMDSRESRWLPTVIGSSLNKIIITSALGFDTYLVMRHGARKTGTPESYVEKGNGLRSVAGDRLACYFCCDVTAPGNSLKDRSLDQQCTVARPGVSAIAGALAVELAVSLLQHKESVRASAYYCVSENGTIPDECVLGIVPHAIRGFLSTYSQIIPATERYDQCVACSDPVLDEYEAKGFDFLLKVFESSRYLEELTGLEKMYKDSDLQQILELSDSDLSS